MYVLVSPWAWPGKICGRHFVLAPNQCKHALQRQKHIQYSFFTRPSCLQSLWPRGLGLSARVFHMEQLRSLRICTLCPCPCYAMQMIGVSEIGCRNHISWILFYSSSLILPTIQKGRGVGAFSSSFYTKGPMVHSAEMYTQCSTRFFVIAMRMFTFFCYVRVHTSHCVFFFGVPYVQVN